MGILVQSEFIKEDLLWRTEDAIMINVVVYGHPMGLPARLCAGLVPAVDLAMSLESCGLQSTIRVIDPTPIANYCNGWEGKQFQQLFREAASEFLSLYGFSFFFDEAEQVNETGLALLSSLGNELENSDNAEITDIVERIKESGRRHGGEAGSAHSVLYMAAHPFSWLDMHHPSIWKRSYPSEKYHYVNLMSQSEERFLAVRNFLKEKRPELCTTNNLSNIYMSICDTPCYIPLQGEPTLQELKENGYDWCLDRYQALRKTSSNHRRIQKDFKALVSFRERVPTREISARGLN